MLSAISFNLDQSKILSSGNGLKELTRTYPKLGTHLVIYDIFFHHDNIYLKSLKSQKWALHSKFILRIQEQIKGYIVKFLM